MVLKKIKSVLAFTQEKLCRKFIEQCTTRRTTELGVRKRICKDLANANFGKSMENTRNRLDVRFASTSERLQKLSRQPNFMDFHIFNEKFVQVFFSLCMSIYLYLLKYIILGKHELENSCDE